MSQIGTATRVLEFSDPAEMQRAVIAMTRQGWTVVSQSSYTPKKGCLRMLAGGFIFFNPKPRHLVTFAWNPPQTPRQG